jgi:uncharacterized protein (DUF58 family)
MEYGSLGSWLSSLPWLALLIILSPVILLAFRGTYPTRRLAWPLIFPLCLSAITVWYQNLLPLVLFVDALFVLVVGLDLLTLPELSQLKITRVTGHTASLGVPFPVTIGLENHSTTATVRGFIRDDVPEYFDCSPEEQAFVLPPSSRITVQHRLIAKKRGAAILQRAYLKTFSRLEIWQNISSQPLETPLNVYPDIKQLTDYAILARTDRLSLIGVRRTRNIGQDNEFERLRDYAPDDNYKHIDWRSTARRNRLTVRQFQADQSQRLLIMLDCGRMMTNEHNGRSLLDYSLNASLMLANVALRQGDAVGMLCFSDRVHTYVPPRGGRAQTNRLLHAGYNQFPRLVESRYDEAFLYLSNYCRRRSLVVLCTNVIDQVNADQIQSYIGNLSGRHLPLAVLLRDQQLFQAADNPGQEGLGLYCAAAASEILTWRQQVISRLRHRGALVVDAFPEEISASLVNQYLEVKAKHLL